MFVEIQNYILDVSKVAYFMLDLDCLTIEIIFSNVIEGREYISVRYETESSLMKDYFELKKIIITSKKTLIDCDC